MKLKSLILSMALMLLVTGGLLAQDTYEYGTVLSTSIQLMFISGAAIDNYSFEKKDYQTQLTMKKLDDLSLQGWELISVTEIWTGTTWQTKYHLRKKKN